MRGYHKIGFRLVLVVGCLFGLACIRESVQWFQRLEKHTKQSRDVAAHRRTLYQQNTFPVESKHFPVNMNTPFKQEHSKVGVNQSIAERFRCRKTTLNEACARLQTWTQPTSCERDEVKHNLKNASGSHVVYCAIEKAGSTFWKRILQVIDNRNNYTSPLDIRTMMAEYQGDSFVSMSGSSWDAIEDLTHAYTSIMFVRNPYTRLFSAWLDKFYSVNTFYWSSIALDIVKSERNLPVYICAYDVTFSELVNYISKSVLSNNCVDRHFSPNFKHCDPCTLDFDYIGKYETLNEDALFILHSLQLTKQVKLPKDAAESDAIKDGAQWVFYQKHEMSKCRISFSCALFRVWQRLQSRGVISNQIPFPFTSKVETESLTYKEFETALRSAHALSKPEELRNNRAEALAQALSTLPEHVERQFQKAFQLDFQLFGYENDTRQYIQGHMGEYQYFQDCPTNLR